MKTRILIVEDERIVAADIHRRLEKMGYQICASVSTGKTSIEQAGKTRPDLVLMDIILEGKMTGIEAADTISCFPSPPPMAGTSGLISSVGRSRSTARSSR
jgi:CheY-like chemotaxis protein